MQRREERKPKLQGHPVERGHLPTGVTSAQIRILTLNEIKHVDLDTNLSVEAEHCSEHYADVTPVGEVTPFHSNMIYNFNFFSKVAANSPRSAALQDPPLPF